MHAVAMLACAGGAAAAALGSAGVSDEQQTAWLLHAVGDAAPDGRPPPPPPAEVRWAHPATPSRARRHAAALAAVWRPLLPSPAWRCLRARSGAC
jgi:hypothetical protein